MRRRDFLGVGLSGLAVFGLGGRGWRPAALAQEEEPPPASFERSQLVERARQLAGQSHEPRPEIPPDRLPEMDYPAYASIRFRRERAIWRDSDLPFRLEMFHLGHYYRRPVDLHVVEQGTARELPFSRDHFEYRNPELAGRIAEDIDGFAGFRVHHRTDWSRDFLSFLGASYLRAVGESMQYGVSARGIAVETSNLGSEEFPAFTAFWIERPQPGAAGLRIHALLDGRSLTGLYTFDVQIGASTSIQVAANLFPRRRLDNFGLAPITSMYYAGENDWLGRRLFRAEAHDSDGLAMRRGNGEWVWRPLANPGSPRVSTFTDESPRGFGMLQRDRDFDNYNDLRADYEARPNLWIEPLGDWGPGQIELVELPTGDETFDNVIAYWRPGQPLEPGQEFQVSYWMHWGDEMPERLVRPAQVAATRIGRAGRPDQRKPGLKFVVDFADGMLGRLGEGARPEARINVSRGEFEVIEVVRVEKTGAWRVEFDLDVGGNETVDLRMYLALGEEALSETWLYRLEPGDWAAILRD